MNKRRGCHLHALGLMNQEPGASAEGVKYDKSQCLVI